MPFYFCLRAWAITVIFLFSLFHPFQKSFAGSQDNTDFSLQVSPGYRIDRLDWNIANDITGEEVPNVLSELEFGGLRILQLGISAEVLAADKIYVGAMFAYGQITMGECVDSDYDEDNRNGLFSESYSSVSDDHTIDMLIEFGYRIKIPHTGFSVQPSVGLSQYKIHLNMKNGIQTVPASGPFSNLDSTYYATWKSGWAGARLLYDIDPAASLFAVGRIHQATYNATADWNLRSDFEHPESFVHFAEGVGLNFEFGYRNEAKENLDISVRYVFQKWDARPGVDRVFPSGTDSIETRLNDVLWISHGFVFSIGYRF